MFFSKLCVTFLLHIVSVGNMKYGPKDNIYIKLFSCKSNQFFSDVCFSVEVRRVFLDEEDNSDEY